MFYALAVISGFAGGVAATYIYEAKAIALGKAVIAYGVTDIDKVKAFAKKVLSHL